MLIAVAVLLGLVLSSARGALNVPLRVDPNARLDPKETYHVSMWVSVPPIPRSELFVQAIEQLIADFTGHWSNVVVTTTFTPEHLLQDTLREALRQGEPPDVLVNSTCSRADHGLLQVPLSIYLSPEEKERLPPAILAQLSVRGVLTRLPLGYTFRVFAANGALLRAAGIDSERYVRDAWDWDEFFAVVAALNHGGTRGLVLTNAHLPLLRSVAATLGRPTTLSELQAMGEVAQRLGASLGTGNAVQADEDALARFLQGRAGLIGPLNPELTRWLLLTAQKKGLSPLLLPIPFLGPSPTVDLAAVSVALFRQATFRGHRHTRAAAELAMHLSRHAGPVFSTYLALLTDGAQVPPHLDLAAVEAAYANLSLAPAAPYCTDWETVVPVWLRLLAGELSPREFAALAYDTLSDLEKP